MKTMPFDPFDAKPEQRKALYEVAKIIRRKLGVTWSEFFEDYASISVGQKYEDNLRDNRAGPEKMKAIHEYIVTHHIEDGVKHAPIIFDASMQSNWENFLDKHGVWSKVNVHVLGEMGITKQSDREPISNTHVKLGQEYCFKLADGGTGCLLGLEEYHRSWHGMPLADNGMNFLTSLTETSNNFPLHSETGQAIPLRDDHDGGRHGFAFILSLIHI